MFQVYVVYSIGSVQKFYPKRLYVNSAYLSLGKMYIYVFHAHPAEQNGNIEQDSVPFYSTLHCSAPAVSQINGVVLFFQLFS